MTNIAEYYNGFGIIKFNRPLNLQSLNEKELEVFIHELVHALQDSTTTYGLKYINFTMNKLLSQIYLGQKKYITNLPIDITGLENMLLSSDINNILLGDIDDVSYTEYDSIEIVACHYELDEVIEEIYDELLGDYSFVRVPQIDLILKNHGQEIAHTHSLGTMTIMEGMASLVEQNFMGNSKGPSSIQYDLIRLLCDYIFPEIIKSEMFIVAACDASLMFNNPALVLISTLQFMEIEKIKIYCVEDVYNFFFDRNRPLYLDEFNINKEELSKTYKKLFPQNDELFSKLYDCYVSQFKIIECNSKKRSEYIRGIMNKNRHEVVEYMRGIVGRFDSLILLTQENEIHSGKLHTDLTASTMLSFKAIHNLFNSDYGTPCELYKFCTSQNAYSVPDECKSNPLGREFNVEDCSVKMIQEKWSLHLK